MKFKGTRVTRFSRIYIYPGRFFSRMNSEVKEINIHVDALISRLKRRQISGSYVVAIETAQLLMRVISMARWSGPDQLILLIRQVGKKIIEAQPREFSSGNIVRRVLSLIRDEVSEISKIEDEEKSKTMMSSMFSLLSIDTEKKVGEEHKKLHKNNHQDLRSVIIQGIRELIDEVSSIHENIETMSVDLIHDNEVLLTPSSGSKTVLNFLLQARLKRKFTVLVTECFPNDTRQAHEFAKKLAEAKIETVVIPDSTVFAVMSRVGKVLVGARSVFANGGCVTSAGVATVCQCAKEHKTPVFTVAGLYKLSPCYPFDRDDLIEVGNSGKVIQYQDPALVGKAEVSNPVFDYVVPENIDLYITNV